MITAAGILLTAETTGRTLLVLRSEHCDEPHTWAGVGGSVEPHETPLESAVREFREETGCALPLRIDGLVEHEGYATFLATVAEEFEPDLNWEATDHRWCLFLAEAHPLHPGLVAILELLK